MERAITGNGNAASWFLKKNREITTDKNSAKKLVKMAVHTYACNSLTSFKGGTITGHGNAASWFWKKNREITTDKPEYEKWPLKRHKQKKIKNMYNFIYESWYIIYFIDRCEVAWHNLLNCCGKHDY